MAEMDNCTAACQVSGALRGIGDNDLAGRFDDACARIKRDIIFAASLYL
jgi:superfamily II RNA helicase